MTAPRLAVTACAVLAVAGCGSDERPARGDRQPGRVLTLDWRKGTYEGVNLRSTTAELVSRLGPPARRGTDEPIVPVGADLYDVGGPTFFRTPGRKPSRREMLRFHRRAFVAVDGRIAGWVTTSARAETPEGVGVGDGRGAVKRRYPDARCFTANESSDYQAFPLCEIRACRGRLLAFGGDPIASIWLVAETRRGWRACRAPARTRGR